MALDSLLIRLKRDVSHVSGVQATVYAGLSRYVMKTVGVSDVSDPAPICAGDTFDTAAQNRTYQPEPVWNMACTADTSDTCKKINAEVELANDPPLDRAQWLEIDREYQRHHFNCPTCIAAGQGRGLRCGVGASLWANYQNQI